MNHLKLLAEFIQNLTVLRVPPKVLQEAKLRVLDTVGAAVGASRQPLIQKIISDYIELINCKGKAYLWGQGEKKMSFVNAAFLNAMMAHTLEMDDVHTRSKTHIGTVVVPSAWAMAEHMSAKGMDFLLAVICGYETMARIGMGFGVVSHRNKGWHSTSTAGTFGAAAACAKLLRLDTEQTLSALGMAGTQSFGRWAFLGDGASCKILHPARAAASGAEAAVLARAGMTGPEHILDADDGGLFPAVSEEYDVSLISQGLGTKYELMEMDLKPYPCCRSTHCAIDATMAICTKYGITWADADKIEEICVKTYMVGYKQCGIKKRSKNPITPVDAKFSIPYTVACIVLFGKVTPEQFKQTVIDDPRVQKLLARVSVESDDDFSAVYPEHWGCELTIQLCDGSVFCERTEDALGSVYNPLTEELVTEKARSLMEVAYGNQSNKVINQILSIDQADVLPAL